MIIAGSAANHKIMLIVHVLIIIITILKHMHNISLTLWWA